MERILVIEDEVVIRRALSKLLQRKGYAVFEAGSVAEGEEKSQPGLISPHHC